MDQLIRHNHLTTQDRRRRWFALAIAVLTLAAGLTNVTLTAPPAHAVNGDGSSHFASYNMQGSNNGSRWGAEIQDLARENSVVSLQEAGAGPPTGATESRPVRVGGRADGGPGSVRRATWPAGPNGSNRYVYFLQTDPQRVGSSGQDTWEGGRTNLAMVTDSPADEVRVLDNPHYDPDPNVPGNRHRARPLLGLRFGNNWYWDIHARGHDVGALLRQVRNFEDRPDQRGRGRALLGDFNRNILHQTDQEARETLGLRDDEELVRTGDPTFISGDNPSELDYGVLRGMRRGTTLMRPGGRGSDHVPVIDDRTPTPTTQPTRSHAYSTVMETPAHTVLQENANGSLVTAQPGHGSNQTWETGTTANLDHILQNRITGHCVTVGSNVRRDVSSRVVAGNCDDPRAQWSVSDPDGAQGVYGDSGGPQRWRNVAFPGLCLTPGDNSVTAAPCTEDSAQRWWDNPSSIPPNDWKTTSENVRLESAFIDGSRLKRRGFSPGTETYTAPTPPKSWWIYWMSEWLDFGWNIQRVSRDDNLVRIQSTQDKDVCLGSQDEHATEETTALLQKCDGSRGVDAAGQRWLAESFGDGTVRYRNEANHLCLRSPNGIRGNAKLDTCDDLPIERWNVVKP